MAPPMSMYTASMAYALLRHAGVPVGKADFLGPVPLIDLA